MREHKHFIFLDDRDLDGPFVPSEDEFISGDHASSISRDGSISHYSFCGEIGDDHGKFKTMVEDFEESFPKVIYGSPTYNETDLIDGAQITLTAEINNNVLTVTQTLVFVYE